MTLWRTGLRALFLPLHEAELFHGTETEHRETSIFPRRLYTSLTRIARVSLARDVLISPLRTTTRSPVRSCVHADWGITFP
ncbi:hypothetical protein C2E23DRAFT_189827 [Lenzites betulinus]|nr:hypothetical protein C2E23DRAFT_189827 [Lenzites betulinus]